MSTKYAKKSINENVEAVCTDYDSNYIGSHNIICVQTEQDIEETSSEFDICNPKLTMEDGFLP